MAGTSIRRNRPRRQRGMAMIALITMVTLFSAYLISSMLSRTTAEVRLDNDERTRNAMQEAKAALIAYAAQQAWTITNGSGAANDQPGNLPCPSADENGGSISTCTTEATRVGRFPWAKVGANKIYDGSGNLLWYALSANFRNAPGTTIINSDTQGTLTVTGTSPATKVVALIIAPGSPLGGQLRSSSAAIANYLEGSNANTADSDTYTTATSSDTFNDQVLVVTQAELMAVIEPAVASRIESTIKPYLTAQLTDWGRLPFPAYFNDPGISPAVGPGLSGSSTTRAQSTLLGNSAAATGGLLPLSTSVNSWSSATGSLVSATRGKLTTTPTCASVSGADIRCTYSIQGTNSTGGITGSTRITSLVLKMVVTADYVGRSFSFKPTISSVTTTNAGATATFTSTSFTVGSMNSSGAATITYQGQMPNCTSSCSTVRTVTITISDLLSRGISASSDTDAGWFIKNEWYRQTYYAVAPGYLPGGAGSCTAGTNCLTVNNLDSTTYPTKNDKQAILILMGSSLNGSSRPSSTASNYLEGENTTPADYIFEHRKGYSSTINDRAVVVSP